MIIWTRWGFLSFVGFALGIGVAIGVGSLLGITDGALLGATVFFWAALINLGLAYLVYPRLDQPIQATVTRPLPQPYTWPDGRVQTHEVMPAVDELGRPVWIRNRSTLFFIPGDRWWIPLGAVSLVLAIAALFVD